LPQVATGIPLGILLITASLKASFFKEIVDAAKIDGCTDFQILRKIVVPLSSAALVTFGVFKAVLVWSEFTLPLIVLKSSENYTLPLAMQVFRSKFGGVLWAEQFAGLTLCLIPMIIMFVIFSRQYIQGMAAGAVKG
jgi:ABC-type glycerol-3-phosphate transport system permease component